MKMFFSFVITCVLSFSVQALSLGADIPSSVSAVEMLGTDGAKVSLANIKSSKGTLVFFTCNHCPYSKAWEERYSKFGNEAAAKGLGVIAINPNNPAKQAEDSLENMRKKAARLKMSFPYVVDEGSKLAKAFGAEKTPEFFLFDAKGKLIYTGAFDDSKDVKNVEETFLSSAVDAMLSGKPIAKAETRAVGCGIKFWN
jgi:peroxiredoxin